MNAMSSKDELKRAVCDAIDRHADAIIDLGETILRNPETGFNEIKTAALVAQRMTAMGLQPHTHLALTGVKGRLPGDVRFRARVRAEGQNEVILREETTKFYDDNAVR